MKSRTCIFNPFVRILFTIILVGIPALAGNYSWVATTTSDWSTTSNWDTRLVPGSDDTAYINNGGTAEMTASATCAGFTLGNGFGQDGALDINLPEGSAFDFGMDKTATVGNYGNGTVVHHAGPVSGCDLSIGMRAGGTGSYTMESAGSTAPSLTLGTYQGRAGSFCVGFHGEGSFTQNAGEVQLYGGLDLAVWRDKNSEVIPSGTYELHAGSLSISGGQQWACAWIGDEGTGVFDQLGGSVDIDGDLLLGFRYGIAAFDQRSMYGNGTYNMQGGTLSVGRACVVGGAGDTVSAVGTMIITGGDMGPSGEPPVTVGEMLVGEMKTSGATEELFWSVTKKTAMLP